MTMSAICQFQCCPLTEDCRLILTKHFEEKKVLEESLEQLLGRRSNGGEGNRKYKIIDIDNSELSLDDLLINIFLIPNPYLLLRYLTKVHIIIL